MFLIVGLGNPGKEYEHTRHNVGFDAIDLLAEKYNIELNRKKFKGMYGDGNIAGEKVILLKPLTYMNLSGESVREIMDFYKITNEDIIVIYDDISLEVGRMRIREKGSAGGHNGIKNIIAHLNTDYFPRVKVGVGQPVKINLVSHVLGKFEKEDESKLNKTFEAACNAVQIIIEKGTAEAMNKFNGFKAEQ
ncbi:aminoacyl-tRNA hydrolase [Clostridium botulinum]|uniref:Peptidyl-tRNA hydrolase n=1 Tax=Clostridium botulinum C/D str. DC5 TaxID=1443128 RepID=A0A0A0I5C8_CLOBO|nr:aminoacyl-tRNA hydrolase [Clostridium botulinum]KEI00725.1 peptidyl-tRNA hydrolase [Clostridium botulinum C/D str. BKT75002]KEI08471.1 peptidyl-tRNA hydrolase [Clostridium botulinum C/D str. BKT2873]KGM96047.1 peptidyl-tRNA hydrolase [Clostridium botulinum C/D str. DC5]KGM96730.1 peptidyl-tRNA hydrolase [Clostridium botulinum D str. CCUG 7971]KOC51264.1 peptidyl-tRNA hydrolase [Clostridium botulinum]